MRLYISLLVISLLLVSACDSMRPEPIESALAHLTTEELKEKVDRSLHRLEYSDGEVGVNLGRVGMRMELRTVQSCLEQLGYFEGPRLGILDSITVDAIDRYLENRSINQLEKILP